MRLQPILAFSFAFPLVLCTRSVAGDVDPSRDVSAEVRKQIAILQTSKDVKERRNAAVELGKLGSKARDAVPALIKAIDDEDDGMQIMAMVALRGIGPSAKEALPRLIKALGESRTRGIYGVLIPRAAAEALGAIGEPAVPELVKVLRDKDSADARHHAARALAVIGPKAKVAVPVLEEAFKENNPILRIATAAALVRVGADGKEPLGFLLESLGSDNERHEQMTREALVDIGEQAIPVLLEAIRGRRKSARRSAAQALGKIGEKAIPHLRDALRDKDLNLQLAAVAAFSEMEKPAVTVAIPVLIDAMKHATDEEMLEKLAKTIAHAEEAAVPALVGLIKESRGEVRRMAMYSLGRIDRGTAAAVPVLIEMLTDKDPEFREGAAYTLGKLGPVSRTAVPALMKAVKENPANLRGIVIEALGKIGVVNDEVLALVLAGLKDKDAKIRSASVEACGSFGPAAKEAVPDLIKLLDDVKVNSSDTYPKPVVWTLGRIGPAAKAAAPKLLAELKNSDIEHATSAAAALLSIGTEEKAAVAIFASALDKSRQRKESHIRFRTLGVLERLGSAGKPAVPILLAIIKDEDDDLAIRRTAATALVKIDREAAKKASME